MRLIIIPPPPPLHSAITQPRSRAKPSFPQTAAGDLNVAVAGIVVIRDLVGYGPFAIINAAFSASCFLHCELDL